MTDICENVKQNEENKGQARGMIARLFILTTSNPQQQKRNLHSILGSDELGKTGMTTAQAIILGPARIIVAEQSEFASRLSRLTHLIASHTGC